MRPPVELLAVTFDSITRDEMLSHVDDAVRAGRSKWITFVNVAILVQMRSNAAARLAVEAADFRLCDGMGVVYAAKILGTPLAELVGGPLLMARLLEHAQERAYGVFLLGGTPAMIERTVTAARRRYPRLHIAGHRHGFFSDREEAAVVQQVKDSGAHILMVSMGFPREKLFLERRRHDLECPVIVDLGGAFTILAGVHKLAPAWIQRAGFEWAYRCWQEPRRLAGRYLRTNTIFSWLLIRELLSKWLGSPRDQRAANR